MCRLKLHELEVVSIESNEDYPADIWHHRCEFCGETSTAVDDNPWADIER